MNIFSKQPLDLEKFDQKAMMGQTDFSNTKKIAPILIIFILIIIVGVIFYKPVANFLGNIFPKHQKVVPENQKTDLQKSASSFVGVIGLKEVEDKKPVSPVKTNITPKAVVTKTVDFSDPDLNGLDVVFAEIRQSTLEKNIFLLEKYYSEPTRAYFASSGGGRIVSVLKDMQFSNIRKISSVKILVAVTTIEMGGHEETSDMIFVREKSGWKLGVVETANYFGKKLIKPAPVPGKI